MRELQGLDSVNAYSVRCARDDGYVGRVVRAPNFRAHPAHGRRWERHVALPLRLRTTARERRPDVFLSFRNLHAPRVRPPRIVVSVLDLAPLVTPWYHPNPARRAVRRRLAERAIAQGDHFVAISEFSKAALLERFGVPEGRLTVAHLAADPSFGPVDDDAREAVRTRYRLPERFVLTLGGGDPRKNVATAVAAARGLPRDVPLVVAGGAWHGRQCERVSDRVRVLGRVADADLAALYGLADVLVFLSLYEGFGLPPLEAMACGTAVVCSRTTSLPEVVGDAAVLVDPLDVEAVAGELTALLEDDARRRELVARGRRRAAGFSWRQTAAAVLRALTG